MTSRNEAKLNMYRAVKLLCDDNLSSITSLASLLAIYNLFKAKLSTLITTVTSESAIISGIAVDKLVLKKNLAQNASDIAAVMFAYASSVNNNTLKDSINFSFSDLTKLKDDMLAPACTNIYTAANGVAAALVPFGISASMLTTFSNSITEYSNAVPKPRVAKSNKIMYSKNIRTFIKEIDSILKDQLDKGLISLKVTKPDFVNAYKNARVIIDPATSTTQLRGKIVDKDTGLALKNVTVNLSGASTQSTTTSKSGIYSFKPLLPGLYSLHIELEAYLPIDIPEFHAIMGKINKQDIELESA